MATEKIAKQNFLLKDLVGLSDFLARLRRNRLNPRPPNSLSAAADSRSELCESKIELHHPFQISHYDLRVPGLPKQLKDYTIVQLTDFHFGPTTPLEHIKKSLELTADIDPDLLVLTGDYVQLSRFDIRLAMAKNFGPTIVAWGDYRRKVRRHADILGEEIDKLKPRDGIIATLGNHDYSEGARTLKKRFPDQVTWLVNENLTIERDGAKLLVAGLDDTRYGKPNFEDMLKGTKNLPAKTIKLLLSHNPDHTLLEDTELLDDFHLTLCGHTHGGQLCLPGGHPLITRTYQKKHFRGASVFQNTPVYVSNGVGYGGLTLRIFCPPEIAVFKLTN